MSHNQIRNSALLSVGIGLGVFAFASGWSCPFAAAGVACPSCGCTRAATALLHEGPVEAFRNQPTASLVLLTALLVAIAQFVAWWREVPNGRRLRRGVVRTMASVLTVNWLFQLVA